MERHDAVTSTDTLLTRLNEFLSSDMWALFTGLALLPVFDNEDMDAAMRFVRTARSMMCKADVSAVLDSQPICTCGYSITNSSDANALISRLSAIVASSLKRTSQLLTANRSLLAASVSGDLLDTFENAVNGRGGVPKLSAADIVSLKTATADLSISHSSAPDQPFASLSDILLENELDRLSVLSQ